MNLRSLIPCLVACAAALSSAGCNSAPGKPGPGPAVARPDQLLDFPTLYAQNCAACHGVNGNNGAAISLANPVYLAVAGVGNIQRVTALGVPGTAMPPFARSAGGMLTDQQIAILSQQMVALWGNPTALNGVALPAYASSAPGDPARGQQAFTLFCARCHGADATGGHADNGTTTGSLVDPAYLALISDQGLRSILIAGQPEQGMPDWRHHLVGPAARPITGQEIADLVAWLTSHRIATPGQPYQSHP
ncbi:MAG TPA: cytochrome c [Acidobacteriaceae bacterium]|jgi:cytochrome c oxidase cbb3-type subunit 3/ubiquinol-cytochrome c reductase cytochrome c subunit|nr:cytochrome c [Acidobacteriaceae bacterium]